ncbi:MAG: FAD-dependent oxidoreductase [Oscillospiraceae bacterium]|nr:FAD-dependent oxidoreductase [Oscillospiraceae bacterium]
MAKSLLLKKGRIGSMELKNRVVMAPMGTTADGDGGYSARTIRYFEERAKGGTGLIITGRNASVLEFEGYSCSALSKYHHVNRLAALADRVHAYGCKLCVQIGPGLGRIMYTSATVPPYSCSPIPTFWFPDMKCKELTVDDIKFITDKVGYSAKLAKDAGADAIEMHAYGSYLADQFMTEAFNHRTDQYGGSLENRVRFLGECIESVQKYCGKDFPQIIKFTPVHCLDVPGYRKLEEGVEIAKLLEKWGAHALHVDTGCYEVWYRQIPTVYQKEGCQLFAAEAVKKAVSIPVITQGKLNRPEYAEKVLEDGTADFIALGHQHIADPLFVQKVKEKRFEDIRPCIGCNECLRLGHLGRNYSCSVNPVVHHEDDFPLTPAKPGQSVLIIGGGPGGMQAAITAAERGMRAELWEKTDKLGGMLLAAGAPDFKKDVLTYVEYLKVQLGKSGVPVVFNKDATAKEIAEAGFDRVIIATGAEANVPNIPGVENTVEAIPVLLQECPIGDECVIIGGGVVGVETALFLDGLGKKVTVLVRSKLKYAEEAVNNVQCMNDMLKASGVKVIEGAVPVRFTENAVVYSCGGAEVTVHSDTTVLATGYHPLNALADELEELDVECDVIGNAVKARKIINATGEAYMAVRRM